MTERTETKSRILEYKVSFDEPNGEFGWHYFTRRRSAERWAKRRLRDNPRTKLTVEATVKLNTRAFLAGEV